LFDRQFERQRMGDGEFGLRAYLQGFKSISNPYASCIDIKAGTGGLRQMGSWDGFRPKSWLAPRPVPSVLYLCRKYFGDRAARYLLLKGVPPSLISYRYKRNSLLLLLGLPLTLLLLPLVVWQVWRAWSISSDMLQQGAKIPTLTPLASTEN
ncbi:MAG: glycosyltransferase family 2 protein, partial [Deltaproteobacteria bacterium]